MTMITYVTAFLHGKVAKRSIDDYKKHFDRLVETGIRIVLFLDHRSTWTFPGNVHVERVSLEETWAWKCIPQDADLPKNPNSDTLEYLQIQNTKSQWLVIAEHIDPFKTDWFAWIDFGIVHVFRDPDTTLARIRDLTPPEVPCIEIAGIWGFLRRDLDNVNWRFAGGFLLVHRSCVNEFFANCCNTIRTHLPKVTWEVNIWAIMEADGFKFRWFPADHDDRIIPVRQCTSGTDSPETVSPLPE